MMILNFCNKKKLNEAQLKSTNETIFIKGDRQKDNNSISAILLAEKFLPVSGKNCQLHYSDKHNQFWVTSIFKIVRQDLGKVEKKKCVFIRRWWDTCCSLLIGRLALSCISFEFVEQILRSFQFDLNSLSKPWLSCMWIVLFFVHNFTQQSQMHLIASLCYG